MHITSITLLIFGLLLMTHNLSGCTWTLSQDRSKRISDCLAGCNESQPAPPEWGSSNPDRRVPDQRSTCEQRCHSLK